MTALELINLINSVLFIGLAVVGLRHALRQPSRATFDTALLFGAIAAVVVLGRLATWMGSGDDPFVTALLLVLLNIVPLAMLRLVDDFRGTPRWVQAAGLIAFVAVSVLAVVAFQTTSQLVELVTLVFFAAVGGYAAIVFFVESRRTRGITRRRMTAVASGAGLFIGAIVVLFIGALVPSLANPLGIVAQLGALVAVIAFFLGFAPPAWVRRAWREPDLRRFLERSAHLASVPDERAALTELQAAAAAAFGASGASVGIADHERRVIRYPSRNGGWVEHPDDAFIAGRAFTRAAPPHRAGRGAGGSRARRRVPIRRCAHGDRGPRDHRGSPHRRPLRLRRPVPDLRRGRPLAPRAARRPDRRPARGADAGRPRVGAARAGGGRAT